MRNKKKLKENTLINIAKIWFSICIIIFISQFFGEVYLKTILYIIGFSFLGWGIFGFIIYFFYDKKIKRLFI